jgi:hypothetical protein
MLASEDYNELNEATWRDIATFSSLYFLGDYVAKFTAEIFNKIHGKNLLLNYNKEKSSTDNMLKKVGYGIRHWVKDTKLKSFDEAGMVSKQVRGYRAICEVSSLGFSMLLLGFLLPHYVRKHTEKKQRQEVEANYRKYHSFPMLNIMPNKKTFQAFGMTDSQKA